MVEEQEEGDQYPRVLRVWSFLMACFLLNRRMRGKEGAVDYRFFPEPDLPPLVLDDGVVEELRQLLPELPQEARRRLVKDYGLSR